MGSIVSGITDAIGLTDTAGEKRAAEAAAAAQAQTAAMSKEQIELMKEQLQFQKDQYSDWKAVYGDIQENLGEYYNNLTGDKIATMGLQNQQKEYQAAVKAIEKDAAQRGIANSGVEYATKSAATFQNAAIKADIRSTADQKAAEQKLGFLGVGLGQGTQMLGEINNAASNVNTAFNTGIGATTQFATNQLSRSTTLNTNNTNAIGEVVGSAIGWASGGASKGYYLP